MLSLLYLQQSSHSKNPNDSFTRSVCYHAVSWMWGPRQHYSLWQFAPIHCCPHLPCVLCCLTQAPSLPVTLTTISAWKMDGSVDFFPVTYDFCHLGNMSTYKNTWTHKCYWLPLVWKDQLFVEERTRKKWNGCNLSVTESTTAVYIVAAVFL